MTLEYGALSRRVIKAGAHCKEGGPLLTEIGATALANVLKRYWAERGYKVEAWVEPCYSRKGTTLYTVRSDLVNGAPRCRL